MLYCTIYITANIVTVQRNHDELCTAQRCTVPQRTHSTCTRLQLLLVTTDHANHAVPPFTQKLPHRKTLHHRLCCWQRQVPSWQKNLTIKFAGRYSDPVLETQLAALMHNSGMNVPRYYFVLSSCTVHTKKKNNVSCI